MDSSSRLSKFNTHQQTTIRWFRQSFILLFLIIGTVVVHTYVSLNSSLQEEVIDSTQTVHEVEAGDLSSMRSKEQIALSRDRIYRPPPFSTKDPVGDLKLYSYNRPKISSPQKVFGELNKGQERTGFPLPTNAWYENMLLLTDEMTEPSADQHVYTIPYVISAIGPVPGIKLNPTRLLAMDKIVQVTFVDSHGLTLGAAGSFGSEGSSIKAKKYVSKRYSVDHTAAYENEEDSSPLTPLGLTLKWEANEDNSIEVDDRKQSSFMKMTSSVVRGMPYGTMQYHYSTLGGFGPVLPTVVSEIGMITHISADSDEKQIICETDFEGSDQAETLVNQYVTVTFLQSEFTWLVFYSEPVHVRCYEIDEGDVKFVLQATRLDLADGVGPINEIVFTSRITLANNCTYGGNPSYCHEDKASDKREFSALLKKHADVFPGRNTKIDYTFPSENAEDGEYSYLQFDWDPRDMKDGKRSRKGHGLLMYSLPHHREILSTASGTSNGTLHCDTSLNGQACLVLGSNWVLKEDLLDGEPSFFAPRLPKSSALPNLAKAIGEDLAFRLPRYYRKGAGDTYFSGKMLAKLSRILLITKEMKDICQDADKFGQDYLQVCQELSLPTTSHFDAALDHLRSSTEIWINGTAQTPFVYDGKWAGLSSCGCHFNEDTQQCNNVFPDCPSFSDPGLDFGHAFYNDHHFHQGYHIYAAATIAYFDEEWGKKYFENVLLLIRDIANPSFEDKYFPVYRMKDWYLGNSWAGGISRAYPNGRNQESSSESIAAYEAVSLFGSVMIEVWSKNKDTPENEKKVSVSRHVRDVGRLLTATELRAADRYWHVRQSGPKSGIYPLEYKPFAVGIMWNMMAQFQTWFGNAPHLAYGIQLLPLTPVSERRDDVEWSKQMYPDFSESCRAANDCDEEGWGILQHAILATAGHIDLAIKYAENLPKEVFQSAGGNGHSRTNSIWYYATRPKTSEFTLPTIRSPSQSPAGNNTAVDKTKIDCGCPKSCTAKVLGYMAAGFTCGDRIKWVIVNEDKSEFDACSRVAGVEYTDICAGCDPNSCRSVIVSPVDDRSDICPPCAKEVCSDKELNRCPVLDAPFLCTDGTNIGGCSATPWLLNTSGGGNCNVCCRLSVECS